MTGRLLTTFKQQISNLKLIPAGGGCFELTVDGEVIYSKLQTGKFPEEATVVAAVGKKVNQK